MSKPFQVVMTCIEVIFLRLQRLAQTKSWKMPCF